MVQKRNNGAMLLPWAAGWVSGISAGVFCLIS
jgi:hypothetical protein